MRMRAASTSVITSTGLVLGMAAPNCVKDSLGNSYCAEVNEITYGAFPGAGTYGKVTGMDANVLPDGVCTNESFAYKGVLAPFDEEVRLIPFSPLYLTNKGRFPGTSAVLCC